MEAACLRELREETGVRGRIERLVGVFSRPGRDPKRTTVSVAFLVAPTGRAEPREPAQLIEYARSIPLAFDHHEIIKAALKRATA